VLGGTHAPGFEVTEVSWAGSEGFDPLDVDWGFPWQRLL
jgi:hypothetical protein